MSTTDPLHRPVIVGVIPDQSEDVVLTAASFAQRLGVDLVCASVDTSRTTVQRHADGTVEAISLDPDAIDIETVEIDPATEERLGILLDPLDVHWRAQALAGGAAQELEHLADDTDATMIVVGTRDPGLRATVREFVNGSVAVQLAHRQHHPVLVVPLHPVGPDDDLPWQKE
jgi:nucleotide-binding universal stress UspA family protein